MAGDLFHLATVQENLKRGSLRTSLFKCRRKVQSWLLLKESKEKQGKSNEDFEFFH